MIWDILVKWRINNGLVRRYYQLPIVSLYIYCQHEWSFDGRQRHRDLAQRISPKNQLHLQRLRPIKIIVLLDLSSHLCTSMLMYSTATSTASLSTTWRISQPKRSQPRSTKSGKRTGRASLRSIPRTRSANPSGPLSWIDSWWASSSISLPIRWQSSLL